MAGKHGKWDELFEQCKTCYNLRVFSLFMDGNHTYDCSRYPLTEDVPCPKRKPITDEEYLKYIKENKGY